MSPLLSGLASVASLLFNASGGSAKPRAHQRGSDAGEALASAVVTLSPQAEALAGLANQGVLASPVRTGAGAPVTGAVSVQDFQELLTRFGADDAQKAQITAGLDSNRDGSISQQEFLKGLASTSLQKPGSGLAQAMLQVMDRGGNADGVVQPDEFAALATAFAQAERRAHP